MTKRSNGEGSLCRRSNGTWLAQVTIEGRRKTKTFRLKKDAQAWLTDLNKQIQQGLTYSGTKTTVEEALLDWLIVKKQRLRISTFQSYRRISLKHIVPRLGKFKIHDLTPARIQAFYNDLTAAGVGKRSIEQTHLVLHGLLKYARIHGLVANNWASVVEVPRHQVAQMSVWNESQVSQFLIFVKSDPFYRLAFSTGMRKSEILGLQWKDLDWQAGTIYIRRQVVQPEGGGFDFGPPKTKLGIRKIRLGAGLIEALKIQQQVTIPAMKTAVSAITWKDYDLIFPSRFGTPISDTNIAHEFQNLIKQAGLPQIRFHDIRHTAASLMLLHGEPLIRVAAILGDTLAVLLSTYAHYIPDDQERASKIMDEITTTIAIDCITLHHEEVKNG